MTRKPGYGMPWWGSKAALADRILAVLPSAVTFCDLFAGGCAMTHAALVSGRWLRVVSNDVLGTPEIFRRLCLGELDPSSYRRFVSRDEFLRSDDVLLRLLWSYCSRPDTWGFSGKSGNNFSSCGILPRVVSLRLSRLKRLCSDPGRGRSEWSHRPQITGPSGSPQVPASTATFRIPRRNVAATGGPFDHQAFFGWCEEREAAGQAVFFSSFEAPPEFRAVLRIRREMHLAGRAGIGGGYRDDCVFRLRRRVAEK